MSSTKIAIKLLKASDLSFFKAHLNPKITKQKAINLNSDVFIDQFYPGLKAAYEPVFFPFTIIGPAGKTAHRLARKALRTAKNWRLNGEIIHDPDGEPGRYDGLAPDDFAVIAFEGNERPKAVTLVLVSANGDAKLRAAIASFFEFASRSTMVEVSEAIIADLRAATIDAYAGGGHPFDALVFRDTIEEVLFGNTAPAPMGAPPSGRSVAMSPLELRQQILTAEETGLMGEELFGNWLANKGYEEDDYEWVSQTHARSAFDYEVRAAKWIDHAPHVFVDVKATRGSFDRPIHMSIAELRFAAVSTNYRIARVYDIAGARPKLRILTGVQSFAEAILKGLASLPPGVVADSVQIKPDVFTSELDEEFQQGDL